MLRVVLGVAALALWASAVGSQSITSETKTMEGRWGISEEECRDTEGPNYNMSIEWPWVSRYEHLCKRSGAKRDGKSIVFEVACQSEGQRKTAGAVRMTLIARDTLAVEFVQGASGLISGKEQHIYRRCSR